MVNPMARIEGENGNDLTEPLMAKDEFFQNVRAAVRFAAPWIGKDNPYTKPGDLQRILRGATIWLTPNAVKGFDHHDFEDLPEHDRESLEENVAAFVKVAEAVPADKPATPEQLKAALPPFMNVFKAVQKLVLEEWKEASNHLVEQAKGWAEAREWPTKSYPKRLSEDLLGTYELKKLVFAAQGTQLVLNPVGRFGPGVDGIVELAVLPDYDSVMIIRRKAKWTIAPLPGDNRRRRWSEGSFVETVENLVRLA
jgi:hypothetical protein